MRDVIRPLDEQPPLPLERFLVAEPPNLWLARDTDGDLKVDTKEAVRQDYGRAEGNPEHNANGPRARIDMRVDATRPTIGRLCPRPGRGSKRAPSPSLPTEFGQAPH